ncbi:MAG: YdcF family protein [Weeksellaceae bacterium]
MNKNYKFFDVLEASEISSDFDKNEALRKIVSQKDSRISKALKLKDNLAIANAFMFSNDENEVIKEQLSILVKTPRGKKLIKELRDSKAYINFNDLPDEKFVNKTWDIISEGLNEVINVYGKGVAPLYPKIDSVSYDPNSDFFKYSVFSWGDLIHNKRKYKREHFYSKPLDFAVSLLYMNHKDEAIRYDSLSEFNQKAIALSKRIDFDKYPYASIIVLGSGPENYRDRLTSIGKLNLQLGVMEFYRGNAPFIIVSGGHVHPYRSYYAEAFEMKKELIEVYNIDEENIIVDPYARHTTTNLRNAARLMIQYKIPIEKPSLVVTNIDHSEYTYGAKYAERSLEELGYKVGEFGDRLSSTTIEFFPSIKNLQQNPLQPLDP